MVRRTRRELTSFFRSSREEEVEIERYEMHRTDLAIRVSPDGREGAGCMWLPLSQIEIEPADTKGMIKITMKGWLAKEKGLEND